MILHRSLHVALVAATAALVSGCASDTSREVYSARFEVVGTGTATADEAVRAVESSMRGKGYTITTSAQAWKNGAVLFAAELKDESLADDRPMQSGAAREIEIKGVTVQNWTALEVSVRGRLTPHIGKHPWALAATTSQEMSSEQTEIIRILTETR